MAALRHAARRLCERAQGSSPVAAREQRRLFSWPPAHVQHHRQRQGPQDELRMEFEDKKQELFNLCVEMRSTGAFKKLSWADFQNLRLTTHLAAQMKPRPDDATWRMYRRFRSFYDFQAAYFCLGFLAYNFLGKDMEKDEDSSGAIIVSDSIEPANERLN